jgi:hypothetical protein
MRVHDKRKGNELLQEEHDEKVNRIVKGLFGFDRYIDLADERRPGQLAGACIGQ